MATVEHVLAYIYVRREQNVVMIAAICNEVIHVEFLQVLAVLEGSVVYNHCGPGTGVCSVRSTVFEHNLFDVLVATQGIAVYGDGLVVVCATYIVIDTHLATQFINFLIVHSHYLHIPGLAAVFCRGEQAVNIKVFNLIDPWLDNLLHLINVVT